MSRQQQGSSMTKARPGQRFHSLNAEQVEILDEVLSEVVPIHGRGNFPTLELRPRDIITAVRARLETQGIAVRDVRLNGSTASHVLVRDNGTSYKDLDIIFGVELPRQEDFQVIKESVLGCLLDCLPAGVNRERISSATMKEAYVQKMVKVFNEHDRWSLISLSNNSGKNLELKFVSVLRRQFEFSVDSFQIILDRLLESYLQQEAQQQLDAARDQAVDAQNRDGPSLPESPRAPETETQEATGTDLASGERAGTNQVQHCDELQESDGTLTEPSQQTAQSNSSIKGAEDKSETGPEQETKPTEPQELSDPAKLSEQTPLSHPSDEETPRSDKIEPPKHAERLEQTGSPVQVEHSEQTQPVNDENKEPHQSQHSDEKESLNQIELPIQAEPSNQTEPPIEREEHLKQLECSKQEENSNPSQAEPGLDPVVQVNANEMASDNADSPECFSEDQRSDEEDQTHSLSVSSAHAQIDKRQHLATETNAETASGQRTEVMSENDAEHVSETEEIDRDEKLATDDSGSTTSLSISPITLCELEAQSSLQSDDTEHMPEAPETMTPPEAQHLTPQLDVTQDTHNTPETGPETQHMTPTRSTLSVDKKASSLMTAKVANRLSQMVVLKHSSPKPPRRMCRKAPVAPLNPNPVSEFDPVVAATSPDPTPEPSPELETASNPEVSILSTASTTSITYSAISTMSVCTTKINPGPLPGSNQTLNQNPTSAPDLSPDPSPVASTEPGPVPAQDPPAFQPSTEVLSEADPTQGLTEIVPTQLACDEECHLESSPAAPAPGEPASQLELPEPSDSPATPAPQGNACHTDDRDHTRTSEGELSDEEEEEEGEEEEEVTGQSETAAAPLSARQESHRSTPPLHSATPPIPGLSPHPPCFTPSSPSLSPPQCLTPPSRCLTPPVLSISPPPSFSSPLLSFSPTSSCLSSPPYLTPPMLSLSPPPSCLSPPLLCLTPPVGTEEDLVPQASSETEPLMREAEGEGRAAPSSSPSAVSLCPSRADAEKPDVVSLLPPVPEAVPFTPTASSPTAAAPPRSQLSETNDSAPNAAPAVPISVPEIKEAAKASANTPEQKNPLRGPRSVPAVEVLAESMYGDFEAAMDHLRYRLIATRNPEEIRGGGLLKYSNLLVRDYRPASETQIKTLERYMCSRFFIDFPDVQEQQRKILSYLKNHFIGEERSKYQYLMTLRRVVDDSTVCLMGHERRQTLNMITVLALRVLGEQNIIPNTDHVTCFYQPAPYLAEHTAPYLAEPSYCSYYVPQGGSTLLYQPYPLHLHTQTGLV